MDYVRIILDKYTSVADDTKQSGDVSLEAQIEVKAQGRLIQYYFAFMCSIIYRDDIIILLYL